jgi:DNA-binding response OmpR family regulator
MRQENMMEKNQRILIVEDDMIQSLAMKLMLEELGYEICDCVVSGEEALDGVERDLPDLVLMDINILGAFDGIDVAGKIIEQFGIPVIMMSGGDNQYDRARGIGVAGYFIKPVAMNSLRLTIESLLP